MKEAATLQVSREGCGLAGQEAAHTEPASTAIPAALPAHPLKRQLTQRTSTASSTQDTAPTESPGLSELGATAAAAPALTRGEGAQRRAAGPGEQRAAGPEQQDA